MVKLNKSKACAGQWSLYILRCQDGSLYTGISTDIARRLEEHQQGSTKGAKSLRGKGPLRLVFSEVMSNRSAALKVEYKVKQLSKSEKEALVRRELSIHSL